MDKIDEWMKRTMGAAAPVKPSNKKNNSKSSFFKRKKKEDGGKPAASSHSQKTKKGRKPADPKQQTDQHKQKHTAKGKKSPISKQKTNSKGKKSPASKQKTNSKGLLRMRLPGERSRMPAQKSEKSLPFLKGKVKVIPLGGLNEIGKNMMAIEYERDIIVIDMGFEFPSEDLLGIDYVIPDVSYLEENKHRIRGVLLTHGHLDHIGGIPYILPKLDFPPVFGAKLTMGLVEHRIKEFKQEKQAKLFAIDPEKPLKLGNIVCEFFRVAHSIPDALGIILNTPVGKIVNTGDFKFDDTPARNIAKADIHKMEALGKQNVLALLCESTNSNSPGHTISEREVGVGLEKAIGSTNERVIIASFSSQIGRVQQIIDGAVKHGRKVFVSGRSMRNNIKISADLGYLQIPKDTIQDIKKYDAKKSPDRETLIITTGSQGEDVAALARIARNEHDKIKIKKGDTVIFSSSPIPGNENAINTVVNQLCILGAKIIHNKIAEIHTSGHAKQDELARMINYIKPKYLIPIHGEYYMRQGLGNLATERCGMTEDRIIMLQNGDVLIAEKDKVSVSKDSVDTKYVLIDGSGEGQVGSQVLMDRQIMSQNGILTVLVYINKRTKKISKTPDVIARGFIYMHESEDVLEDISNLAETAYKRILEKNSGANRKDIKRYIRQTIDKYTHQQLERRPLIMPIIVEV